MGNIKNQGFTLVELFITMLVALILAGIAIPSFSTAMKNSRLAKSSNDLVTSLHRARSEALKRGRHVRLCANTTSCNSDSNDWESGWVVFVDENGDGNFNEDDDDIIINQGPLTKNTIFADTTNSPGAFSYNGRGMPDMANRTFIICDNRPDAGKEVVIARTGRVSSHENTSNDC